MSRGRSAGAVLVDMSNLAVGGGVQVGASFLAELTHLRSDAAAVRRWPWLTGIAVEVSPAVRANTPAANGDLDVRVVDGRPRARASRLPRRHEHDVTFTVFGPDYGPRRAPVNVMGFADTTSLFPEVVGPQSIAGRLKHRVRSAVSRRRFLSVDTVVTESAHVAECLTRRWGIAPERLRVVPNVLHQVFADGALTEAVEIDPSDVSTFAFPTRFYPHKNLGVLGAAARVLRDVHGMRVRFALTLTAEEWQRLDPGTRAVATNVGPLVVAQVPALYAACDGVVFPSLNECFSVTPLEAIRAGRPLVASDRLFVREVVGDAAWYFEPTDPASVARALADALRQDGPRAERVAAGQARAAAWPTARDRACAYLDVIDAALADGGCRSGARSG